MPSSDLSHTLALLYQQAVQARQRRMLVLAGDADWAQSVFVQLPAALLQQPGLWVGDHPIQHAALNADYRCLKPARCHQVLGQEFGWLVIDGHEGVDPDALGACSGTLCGGGILVLLLPSLRQQPVSGFGGWLKTRLSEVGQAPLVASDGLLLLDQQQLEAGQLPSLAAAVSEPAAFIDAGDLDCLTRDQTIAVQHVIRVVEGHRRRPLVISADRGRGKSAALGIAAARLMQSRSLLIRVTAPSIAAVEPLFERLQALLPQSVRQGNRVTLADSRLEFVALDQLLGEIGGSASAASLTGSRCGLLLVDEAAAIPAPMLERLLRQHSRIVFATTTHGYEGTGRGFQLRFRHTLDRLTPNWRQLELQAPIRWAEGDPLERWVFDALLLDAEPESERQPESGTAQSLALSELRFSHWTPQQLIDNPAQLRQLFALLVQAHYRTKPGDLRDLLDDPSMRIWLLHRPPDSQHNDQRESPLVGVLWVAEEGGFEPSLAEQIWLGQRRPRGHLLPQVLAAQAGWRQAAELRAWRIVRIAVPAGERRRGVGGELVQRLLAQASLQQVDLVGTSFGATADLLPFWFAQQLQPLRLGLKRDASSGCVSLLYARACSATGRALVDSIGCRFAADLPYQLQGAHSDLECDLVRLLLCQTQTLRKHCLDPQDRADLYSFVLGQRQLQQVEPALHRWSVQQLSDPGLEISATLQQLLIGRLIQRHHWSELLPELGLSGPKQAEGLLKSELKSVLKDQWGK